MRGSTRDTGRAIRTLVLAGQDIRCRILVFAGGIIGAAQPPVQRRVGQPLSSSRFRAQPWSAHCTPAK
ncbi:hypothetical protein PC121_g19661 [Phytophthora cactorum]|nr:hypothetical protein PC120_g19921 [Phytophthora cactorum]KAG3048129.1 hypothetical protein PC121_g19661 [Phytophthora cactorum]KAG4041198.1 hypothetical protein PC123_g23281 [Phytophthora cactorum]